MVWTIISLLFCIFWTANWILRKGMAYYKMRLSKGCTLLYLLLIWMVGALESAKKSNFFMAQQTSRRPHQTSRWHLDEKVRLMFWVLFPVGRRSQKHGTPISRMRPPRMRLLDFNVLPSPFPWVATFYRTD